MAWLIVEASLAALFHYTGHPTLAIVFTVLLIGNVIWLAYLKLTKRL